MQNLVVRDDYIRGVVKLGLKQYKIADYDQMQMDLLVEFGAHLIQLSGEKPSHVKQNIRKVVIHFPVKKHRENSTELCDASRTGSCVVEWLFVLV